MNPLLTIIIPTYNSATTLFATLNSVLNQTFSDYELIILDNCSTNNTLDIIKNFASSNKSIKWISEPDKGIYDAMNKGISLAKGEWIYFLGSDDKFYNENVLTSIFRIVKAHSPKILYGNVLIDGNAGWAKSGQIYAGEFTLPKLIKKNICHQAIFFNKIVFKKCSVFNIKYNICADWDMNLRLWATYKFYYYDTIIAVFKGGNSSFQNENNYSNIDKWLTILNSFKLKILSHEFSQFSQNFLILSRYYYKKKKYFKSFLLICTFFLHKTLLHL